MPKKPTKPIEDVIRELGRYPIDAFEFLHRGLDYTVQKLHGPADENLISLINWMDKNEVDIDELERFSEEDRLPPILQALIERMGGFQLVRERMNRHVGGEELCWGLRDFALQQWGLMALTVLKCWGIQSTRDFGRMVFALVENNHLQKQDDDQIEDFDDVFSFDSAFVNAYKISASGRST